MGVARIFLEVGGKLEMAHQSFPKTQEVGGLDCLDSIYIVSKVIKYV